MKNILVARSQEQSLEITQFLEKSGFQVFVEPLFAVTKLTALKQFTAASAAIVTSANACTMMIDSNLPKDVKIFAVGKKTAQKLLDAGFKNIAIPPKHSASALRNLILQTHQDKSQPILYFRGSLVNLDLKQELEKFGFKVENILSYETKESEIFSDELLQFLRQNSFDKILLFSKKSADTFFKLATQHSLLESFGSSQICCLSKEILHRAQDLGFTKTTTFNEIPILKKFYD